MDATVVTLSLHTLQALHLPPNHLLPHAHDLRLRLLLSRELVDADNRALAAINLHLYAIRVLLDLALLEPHLDGVQRPAYIVDALYVLERLLLDAIGQPLHVVGSADRVDNVGHAGFVGYNLLRAERYLRCLLRGQRQRLIHGVGVQRLGAAQDGGQRLERGADDVVLRLLRGESGAAGLGVEAKHHRARVLGAEAFLSDAGPHAACGAELRHLLQEVGVGGEEER